MNSRIHNVKEVGITSTKLPGGMGITTKIIVRSQPTNIKDSIEEEIVLFSFDGKLINFNIEKSITNQKKDK